MLSSLLGSRAILAALFSFLALADAAVAEESAITVLTINTEWLWTPHDGSVDGSAFNVGDMSEASYRRELDFYVELIRSHGANLVALQEIENQAVASDVAGLLGTDWRALFKQGRDTATGQDVALLSNLKYIEGSATDFGFPKGYLPGGSKGKRLSKLLGARFVHPAGNKTFWAVTTHFLSRKNDSPAKQKKRLKQVYSLISALKTISSGSSLIVLGDFNSRPYDRELQLLKESLGLALAGGNCLGRESSGLKGGSGFSVSRMNSTRINSLVDHVLYRNLSCSGFGTMSLDGFSDHPAVYGRFR